MTDPFFTIYLECIYSSHCTKTNKGICNPGGSLGGELYMCICDDGFHMNDDGNCVGRLNFVINFKN